MNKEIVKILNKLKEKPSSIGKVDHIMLLQKIYFEYTNGMPALKPIAMFFLSGFDDLPSLSEKALWNKSKFHEIRKDFVDAHDELIDIIDDTLEKIKDKESAIYDSRISKTEFLQQVKSGQVLFEGIDLENMDLRNQKLSGLTFKNCFISADFRNSDLSHTRFIKANIKTSDFRNANLTNGLMQNVSFESTSFKGAITNGFIFIDNYCYSEDSFGQADFDDWIIEIE